MEAFAVAFLIVSFAAFLMAIASKGETDDEQEPCEALDARGE